MAVVLSTVGPLACSTAARADYSAGARYPSTHPRPTIIAALPRSRTAWLANFLYHGPVWASHELLAEGSVDVLAKRMAERKERYAATCETAAIFNFDAMKERMSNARWIWIERPVNQVMDSLRRLHRVQEWTYDFIRKAHEKSEELIAATNATVVHYDELDSVHGLRVIWDVVAPNEPFPHDRMDFCKQMNVQITEERWSEFDRKEAYAETVLA